MSYGQSPALVAIAMKAAIAALQGKVDAAADLDPDPGRRLQDLKDGENYWPDLKANFFAANQFPPCGVELHGAGDHGAEREEHAVIA